MMETENFVFAIDPARSNDNSVCTIAELVYDEDMGWKMKIVHNVSWTDLAKKKKTPIKTPDQIKDFKRMLLDFNGQQSADYENIENILIDSGAGGGGMNAWADGLLEDWKDDSGSTHRGLIDKDHEEYKSYASKYPNAFENLTLLSPKKYKREMFEALIEMVDLNLISFPESHDGKDELLIPQRDGDVEKYKLTNDEILSLTNIDMAKEELVSIYSFKSSNGNVRYDLPPDKQSKIGDDRAYTVAMLAWYLQQLRRENITKKKKDTGDFSKFFAVKKPKY